MIELDVMKDSTKLRSHRYDSIKLMLAWEYVLPLLPSPTLLAQCQKIHVLNANGQSFME
jgi:hypothetical protein